MTQADFVAFGNLIQAVAECYGQTLSAQNVALRFRLLDVQNYELHGDAHKNYAEAI